MKLTGSSWSNIACDWSVAIVSRVHEDASVMDACDNRRRPSNDAKVYFRLGIRLCHANLSHPTGETAEEKRHSPRAHWIANYIDVNEMSTTYDAVCGWTISQASELPPQHYDVPVMPNTPLGR